MPSRRSHTKTRLGCVQCKRRRIKCDEKRPACGRCLNRGTACTFDNTFLEHTIWTPPSETTKQPASLDVTAPTQRNDDHDDRGSFTFNPICSTSLSPFFNDVQALELMHHFSTHTSLSVSGRSHVRQIWQIEIPRVALSYDWLMHCLLSVSALDLASVGAGDTNRYLEASMHHQNIALRSFTPLLSRMTPVNCHAMFAFSGMIVVSAMGYNQVSAEHLREDCLTEIVKLFRLTRGAACIVQSGYEHIAQGIFASVVRPNCPSKPELPADIQSAITALRALNNASTNDKVVKDILIHTIYEIERCWKISHANPADHGVFFFFAAQVPEEYIALLREREPVSLVILAHYAAQLHHLRRIWWMGNLGRRLVEAISKELDRSWCPHLQWPMHEVFTTGS